jgi:hypothetical protein
MRDWEDEFGSEKPTPSAIFLRMQERFPGIDSVVMFQDRDDRDYAVIQQGHYRPQGFKFPLNGTKYYDFEKKFEEELKGKLEVLSPMQKAPGAEPTGNPNADQHIRNVLAYEANVFMTEHGANTFKAEPLRAGCGMKLLRTDKYASAAPSPQLFSDIRDHLQTLFNVKISDLDADNQTVFEVIPYVYKDNRVEMEADRKKENRLVDDGARAEYIEEYIARKGALTPIRHGWVAGYSTDAPELREFRITHECGGATYLVRGSSIAGSRAIAKDLLEIQRLTNVGHQTEEWLYTRCLPDVFTEELLATLRRVHGVAAGAEERETFSITQVSPPASVDLMPKPVMALRVGDRFGTKAIGSDGSGENLCHWCEVKSIEEDTLTAEVLNGCYSMQYDLLTGVDLGIPSHDVPGGHSVIFFTADNAVVHSANYREGMAYMSAVVDAQNPPPVSSEMAI